MRPMPIAWSELEKWREEEVCDWSVGGQLMKGVRKNKHDYTTRELLACLKFLNVSFGDSKLFLVKKLKLQREITG
ncbi:hypothetical protein JHK84_027736 [Glycine max]|nr:hypothetical protein JHK84_027736 [Glycine max]